MWGDGQPLRPTTNVALYSSNTELRGVFGALARVVLLWGTEPFPGGSIGERVLRGPARKGPTAPQREGWGAPAPATPSIPTTVLLFTLLPLPRLCPGHCRGCATSHAAAFPARPNHTHTGGKRVGAPEVPPSVTTTPSLSLLCAPWDESEESVSWGCLGASLGRFSPGAMVPFRGDPSVSVFCVGLPGKGSRQCRERGGTPLIPTTPQTTVTLAKTLRTMVFVSLQANPTRASAPRA